MVESGAGENDCMNGSRQRECLLEIINLFGWVGRDLEQSRQGAGGTGMSWAGCSWPALPVSGCYPGAPQVLPHRSASWPEHLSSHICGLWAVSAQPVSTDQAFSVLPEAELSSRSFPTSGWDLPPHVWIDAVVCLCTMASIHLRTTVHISWKAASRPRCIGGQLMIMVLINKHYHRWVF